MPTQPQVTSVGPGPDPLRTHVQRTGTVHYGVNPTILDIFADAYICINFVPLEIKKGWLFTPLIAIQVHKKIAEFYLRVHTNSR